MQRVEFSAQRMLEVFDLSNESYPRILARQRTIEARKARLKMRENLSYRICKWMRKTFR